MKKLTLTSDQKFTRNLVSAAVIILAGGMAAEVIYLAVIGIIDHKLTPQDVPAVLLVLTFCGACVALGAHLLRETRKAITIR